MPVLLDLSKVQLPLNFSFYKIPMDRARIGRGAFVRSVYLFDIVHAFERGDYLYYFPVTLLFEFRVRHRENERIHPEPRVRVCRVDLYVVYLDAEFAYGFQKFAEGVPRIQLEVYLEMV